MQCLSAKVTLSSLKKKLKSLKKSSASIEDVALLCEKCADVYAICGKLKKARNCLLTAESYSPAKSLERYRLRRKRLALSASTQRGIMRLLAPGGENDGELLSIWNCFEEFERVAANKWGELEKDRAKKIARFLAWGLLCYVAATVLAEKCSMRTAQINGEISRQIAFPGGSNSPHSIPHIRPESSQIPAVFTSDISHAGSANCCGRIKVTVGREVRKGCEVLASVLGKGQQLTMEFALIRLKRNADTGCFADDEARNAAIYFNSTNFVVPCNNSVYKVPTNTISRGFVLAGCTEKDRNFNNLGVLVVTNDANVYGVRATTENVYLIK